MIYNTISFLDIYLTYFKVDPLSSRLSDLGLYVDSFLPTRELRLVSLEGLLLVPKHENIYSPDILFTLEIDCDSRLRVQINEVSNFRGKTLYFTCIHAMSHTFYL